MRAWPMLRGGQQQSWATSVVRCKDRKGHTARTFRFCYWYDGVIRSRRFLFEAIGALLFFHR